MMRGLLKRTFAIWVERRWLKEINTAIDDYTKAQDTADRKYYVLKTLVDAYNERYDKNLWRAEDGRNL